MKKQIDYILLGTLWLLAATLGAGNIIGVSTAVYLGGPGGVFWCWVTGLLGMATTYGETFLSCHYRSKDHEGHNVGGVMYVLERGLGKKKLAFFYSFLICLSAFCAGCTTQSNAISETCMDVWGIPKWAAGIDGHFISGGLRGIYHTKCFCASRGCFDNS